MFQDIDLQFFPTPRSLAEKAWTKFKNRDFVRVLEPSAGAGDLADACPSSYHRGRHAIVDCIEIDPMKHPILREKGFSVVGNDFLRFEGAAHYSHIIMNPPFAQGAQHVLHAWESMWDGEIVAILNAETVRNPFSKERQLLVRLIEAHGEVEFLEGAFATEETLRKTDVEVALVYLRKQAPQSDLVGHLIDEMDEDRMSGAGLAGNYRDGGEIMLSQSAIEVAVETFNLAVKAAREAVLAEARAGRYAGMLGRTMAQIQGEQSGIPEDNSVAFVQKELFKRYENLKDRAWTGILRGTQVTSRVSRNVQKQIESQFEQIKAMEFTYDNVHGFLAGLISSQGNINTQMMLDVFDQITRYHSDNVVWYKGWKSNDRHRSCGMRIKMTRFILPGHSTGGWRTSANWETLQLLRDFDKAFALLDGKQQPVHGLAYAFEHQFHELTQGKRVKTDYFDVRYYPGVGTIHFFPTRKDLVDRLNRLVGRERQWLPPETTPASETFWEQFEKAEKFDAEFKKEVAKKRLTGWRDPFWCATAKHRDDVETEKAMAILDEAMCAVLERHGIDVQAMLAPPERKAGDVPQLELIAA